jgi:hypothetical protein
MPNPVYGDIHVDAMMTNISIAYIQQPSAFVHNSIFPNVPVKKQSDRYFVYLKEDWFRDEATVRVYGEESAGGGYEIDNTPNYFCKIYAYHKDVFATDRANADKPLDPDIDATEFVTQKLMLRREIDFVTRFFATGVWGTEYTGASASDTGTARKYWSSENSTPIEDIGLAKLAVAAVTGYVPNVLLLGSYTHYHLTQHADFKELVKYGGSNNAPAIVSTKAIAEILGLEKVVVGTAVKNSAAKGATESTDFILGKHALLAYAAPSAGLKKPTAGYVFSWSGLEGAQAFGNRIYKFPMDNLGLGTQRIEGEMAYDCELVASDLGVFFNGIVE